ncbi:SRPBCC family protein [Mucilaginibacter antarcticus]
MTSINLNTSITINAPAEKVWKAIVDPAVVEKYFLAPSS